jgi:hypothetical protein
VAEPPHPTVRATDADREAAADRLRRAAGDGQLTVAELDERLDAVYASRTRGDLVPLTADLGDPSAAVAATRQSGEVTVRPGPGGTRWLVAFLGGAERRGRWRLAPRATSVNVLGGSDLDLTQVELASEDTELTVFSFMGGADVYVPDDLDVEVSEFAFMGGNSVDVPERSAGRPRLRLRLWSIMGGTDVRRGPKLSRSERRALRKHGGGHLGH